MKRGFPIPLGAFDYGVLGYAVAWLVVRVAVPPTDGTGIALYDLSYFAMAGVAIATQLRAARLAADARTRWGWRLLALSGAAIVAGYLSWVLWPLVTGVKLAPAIARLTDIAYVPFALAGFVAFPPDRGFSWRDPRVRLDALLFAIGCASLSWHFAIEVRPAGSVPGGAAGAVAEWVLVLVAAGALLRARGRSNRIALGVLFAAQLVFILSDYFAARFPYGSDEVAVLDPVFFAVWVLRWIAARRALGADDEGGRPAAGYRGSLGPALFVAGAYALLVLALVLEPARGTIDVALAAVAMTGILLVRQGLSLRENSGLLRETSRQTAIFRSIVASSSDLILLVRGDLRLAYTSPSVERLAGPVRGLSFRDLVHPDDRPGVLDWLGERSGSLGQRGFRCRFRAADGGWRDVELRAQDRTGDPAVRGLVINGRDISDELALEERLGHARKLAMLSEMAGRIAHAFNNTLAALHGHAEALVRDLPPGTPASDDARAIRSAAERGAGITRQLLGFTGRHVIRPEPLRPAEVVEALRGTLTRLLGPGRPLAIDADAADAVVLMDRSQLEQVLVNLVANARDALREGGHVAIRIARAARPDGREIALVVTDDGVGIPAEHLGRILEPFFTTKAPGKGTGLGLAMVDAIARRAGGRVTVESAVGAGTSVTVHLPEADAAGAPARRASVPVPAPVLEMRRVLLVDDDALVRNVTARMLERAGYLVHACADGAEALAAAARPEVGIDVLVTDLMMPGISGREVIERFRPLRPGVPIVCITGYATAGGDTATLHAYAIVAKPFTAATLLAALDGALASAAAPAGAPGLGAPADGSASASAAAPAPDPTT